MKNLKLSLFFAVSVFLVNGLGASDGYSSKEYHLSILKFNLETARRAPCEALVAQDDAYLNTLSVDDQIAFIKSLFEQA